MSIVQEIIDGGKAIKDTVGPVKLRGSIATESASGILQFPVLTSTALSLEESTLVTKALEREFVSFVAVLTSINSVTDARDINEYLGGFHKNYAQSLKTNAMQFSRLREAAYTLPTTNVEDIKNIKLSETAAKLLMSRTKTENDELMLDENKDVILNYSDLNDEDKETVDMVVMEACKKSKNEACGAKNEACGKKKEVSDEEQSEACKSKNEACKKGMRFSKGKGVDSIVLKEDGQIDRHIFIIRDIVNNDLRLVETAFFPVNVVDTTFEKLESKMMSESRSLLQEYVSPFNLTTLNEATIKNNNVTIIGTGFIKDKISGKLSEASVADAITNKDKTEVNDKTIKAAPSITASEVKKANELAPTMMNITTYFKDSNGALNGVDYMIGVKTIMHPISTSSMIENLVNVFKRGKGFFNLIKLTTGEISFIKDFVFAISRIKDDVKNKYKDNGWWNRLIRSKKSNIAMMALSKGKNQLPPNASIVISEDEVERIKIDYSIDLHSLSNVSMVMNKLHLLAFVIVDPSVETVKIMLDNSTEFQTYSFASLEKENSNSKREVQNIMQVLGRM